MKPNDVDILNEIDGLVKEFFQIADQPSTSKAFNKMFLIVFGFVVG
jgi:hypothetical protein